MWELWSYGEMPYKGWTNAKVVAEVADGYRFVFSVSFFIFEFLLNLCYFCSLPQPKNCPEHIYGMMLGCWTDSAEVRLNFGSWMFI